MADIEMKLTICAVVLSASVLSASSYAQAIYKCVDHGAVTFQQSPCQMTILDIVVSTNTVLVGKWRYDRDTTLAWLKHHPSAKVDEADLSAMAGHLTYTITPTALSVDASAYDVVVDGTVRLRRNARQPKYPYSVLTASAQAVTVSAQDPEDLGGFTSEFHFEGKDSMWLPISDPNKRARVNLPNTRFYFKRMN